VNGRLPTLEATPRSADWFGSPPKSWLPSKLKYLFQERREKSLGTFPPGAISFGEVVEKGMNNEETLASYQDVFAGDFLVNPINLNYDLKSLRVAHSQIDVRVSPAYIVLRHAGTAEPRFLRWLMHQFDVAHMKTLGAGVRQTITFGDMGPCEVYLPTRTEQQRIANFLDEQTARIDALIAEKERLQLRLNEWQLAELERLCFGTTLPPVQTANKWFPRIPADWRLMRLKHLVTSIEQGWSPECESRPAAIEEWGVLKAGAANAGVFREDEHKALPASTQPVPALEVRAGDVLATRASGSASLVGSFAYVYRTRPRLMLSDKNFRLLFPQDPPMLPELLAWACNTDTMRQQIRQFVSGAEGLAKNISSGDIGELWLVVPPGSMQAGIAAEVRGLRERVAQLEEHLVSHVGLLREYRSSLISAAVTGQLDLRTYEAKLPEAA